jgi:hypothetical protein
MVDEQAGLRSTSPRELPLWMKLFSGFKVALDPKKLLLAAAGILVMWGGWLVLSWIFYNFSGQMPQWSDYNGNSVYEVGKTPQEQKTNAWLAFKQARRRWNLSYAMYWPVPRPEELNPKNPVDRSRIYYDEADAADTYEEYTALMLAQNRIKDEVSRLDKTVRLEGTTEPKLKIVDSSIVVLIKVPPAENKDASKEFKRVEQLAADGKLKVRDLAVRDGKLLLAKVEVEPTNAADLEKIQAHLRGAKSVDQIRLEARENNDQITLWALDLIFANHLRPAGQFRVSPWTEYRGPNPYLLVTGGHSPAAAAGTVTTLPWESHGVVRWFVADEIPVLLEPLVKFLRPIVYLFKPSAGFFNRLFLVLIILWTVFTWAVFGGAITRMAAVQVARTNEKIGMTEAVRFGWTRIQAYFSAPVLPLVFLAILTLFLWLYGLVGMWTLWFGDIVVYGLFAPIMLLIGLIMAVVLVGLVGWPLMYSTISAEGSDSFDAISRSYSYVYQAPWHYLWYSVVALVYGAVLVFFIGLMGSLLVYLGKWGMSLAPSAQDRVPTYLFIGAPTSFEWRDLLLHGMPGVGTERVANSNGTTSTILAPTADYWQTISWNNHVAAWMIAVWLGLLFLMVIGFAYSYFWSASTIIYLLMRRKVDDTELDEIHLEEEELEEPYPAPGTTAPTAADKMGGGPSVTMVESPTLRGASSPGGEPPPKPDFAAGPPAVPTTTAAPPPATEGPIVTPPTDGDKGAAGPGGEGPKT